MTDVSLKSIAAQKYYPLGIAESISAQACVLARTMGLHQARSTPKDTSPEEVQERFKVFRSLYLRDKSLSTSRGSICWLPSWDCSLNPEFHETSPSDSGYAVRLRLARLEDESYRLFHSVGSPKLSLPDYQSAVLRIEQELASWAMESDVFSLPYASTHDVGLQLEFLAARICVLRKSCEPDHVRQALRDSRASCLLVIISYGKHEPSMIDQLDELLSSKKCPKSSRKKASGRAGRSSKVPLSVASSATASDPLSLRSHSLLDIFSVPAFFLLAKNVIWPSSTANSSVAEDLDLMLRACACYKDYNDRTQANNHARKVGQSFSNLLEVMNLIKESHSSQIPYGQGQQDAASVNGPTLSHPFSNQHNIPTFGHFSSPSASSIHHMQWENSISDSTPKTTSGSPSSATSIPLLAPMDSQTQSFDPCRQNLHFPQMQQQFMQPPTFSHQSTNDSGIAMDDFADSRLLSDFLETNPSMMF